MHRICRKYQLKEILEKWQMCQIILDSFKIGLLSGFTASNAGADKPGVRDWPERSGFDVFCFLEQNPEEGAEVLSHPFALESGVELRRYGAVFNLEAGAGELRQHPVAVIFAVGHDERFAT